MAKWNKKLGLAFISLGLLTMTPNFANADCSYDPCCDPCSFGGFEIGADFLYWKPCVDNLDYAVVKYADGGDTELSTSKWGYKCVCLDWEPGFRIRLGKDDVWCNWRLDASYTWLDINTSSSCKAPTGDDAYVSSPMFHPIQGNGYDGAPTFDELTYVKGTYDTTYQTWDVLLSYDISCNRCHTFQPFFGVEGLILDQDIKVHAYVDPDDTTLDTISLAWNSDFFGVGLKIGTNYQFQMFDCLKFYGGASGVITVGDRDGRGRGYVTDGSGNVHEGIFSDSDCCQFVPGYHLAVGLLYETDMCGCDFAVRVGWEFVQWHNVSNPRAFSGDKTIAQKQSEDGSDAKAYFSSSSDYTTFGLHGLTVGLDFSF